MAIFWCDPYIESPSGGVDGTTGVGTLGSYANPYSIDNLPSTSSTYTNGDEVRLKALPANPWLTDSLPAWSPSFSIGGSFGAYWAAHPDQHSFIKYTSIKGEKTYLSWNSTNTNTTKSYPPIWGGMSPYADVTLPAYKLDPQYYLSNLATPSKSDLLRIDDRVVTITAGWVSETARGGETIVHRILPTAVTESWFGTVDHVIVDAPELTISHSTSVSNRHISLYGRTVEVHDIIERSGGGSSCSIKIYTGETFKANNVASGGYIYIYSPYFNTTAAQGINRDIKHITAAYQMYINAQGASVDVNLKFKNLSCFYLRCNFTTTFSYYDDFFFYTTSITNQTPTEQAIDSAVNIATVFPLKGPMANLAPKLSYGNNTNYRTSHATPITTSGGYLANGASIDISRGDVYFRDLVLPVGGTLENTTSHGVTEVNASGSNGKFIGKAWGVDRNSGRTIAFAHASTNLVNSMMMYNSTEYNNKLVYHLLPTGSLSDRWYDRVYMDMPTGVSEIAANTNLRLKITLGGTTVGSVKLYPTLDGNTTPTTQWGPVGWSQLNVNAATGGAGTVLYTGSMASTILLGIQQVTLVLGFSNLATNSVAKICIDSIELEAV